MIRKKINNNFGFNNNEYKSFKKDVERSMVGFGLISLFLNLVFWLGLIGGGIWLLKYFEVL